MTTPPLTAPPGWYPDPWDNRAQRWWAGTEWTSHVVYPESLVEPQLAGYGQHLGYPQSPYQSTTVLPLAPESPKSSVVAPPQGRWGLPDIAWELLFFVGSVLITIAMAAVVAVADPDLIEGTGFRYDVTAGAWLAVVLQGLSMLGLVGWPLIAARFKGDGWQKSYGFVVNGRAWLVGGVGGIVTFGTMLVLTAVMVAILGEPVDSAAADAVSQIRGTPLAYVTFLAFIAVGAPFVEEMLFRGLIWGAIVKRGWSPWIATGISGVMFGLIHFEPLRILPLIAAGVLLGAIRHYGGIGASMFAHCIVNSIGVVAILVSP